MRLLVCGGRDFGSTPAELAALTRALDCLLLPGDTLIEGGAPGADQAAWQWRRERAPRVLLEEYWVEGMNLRPRVDSDLERYVRCGSWRVDGRSAGPRRNTRMLLAGRPELALAAPGGDGTADMVRQALAAGVPVLHLAVPAC